MTFRGSIQIAVVSLLMGCLAAFAATSAVAAPEPMDVASQASERELHPEESKPRDWLPGLAIGIGIIFIGGTILSMLVAGTRSWGFSFWVFVFGVLVYLTSRGRWRRRSHWSGGSFFGGSTRGGISGGSW